jgi:hypothetical protein
MQIEENHFRVTSSGQNTGMTFDFVFDEKQLYFSLFAGGS